MNQKGIKFIHERSRPLAVDSMDAAGEAILRALEKHVKGEFDPLPLESFARHLAWIIGFDALVEDRAAVREFTDKLVEE